MDNYHFHIILIQLNKKGYSVGVISSTIVIWIMGISYTAVKYISLHINLDTTILSVSRQTLVRMREKGILLIIVIKCMAVSISLQGGEHDGLTDLYRETTSFANYLNRLGHLYSFLIAWVLNQEAVSLTVKRGPELAFSATLWGSSHTCKLFNVIQKGISMLISIWLRHKNAWWPAAQCDNMKMKKKKYCQHERQPASPGWCMIALHKPPCGEGVKWDWNPDRTLRNGKLIIHN